MTVEVSQRGVAADEGGRWRTLAEKLYDWANAQGIEEEEEEDGPDKPVGPAAGVSVTGFCVGGLVHEVTLFREWTAGKEKRDGVVTAKETERDHGIRQHAKVHHAKAVSGREGYYRLTSQTSPYHL